MLNAILVAMLLSRGTPARAVDNLVIIEGKAGCTVEALNGDPVNPVTICTSATIVVLK